MEPRWRLRLILLAAAALAAGCGDDYTIKLPVRVSGASADARIDDPAGTSAGNARDPRFCTNGTDVFAVWTDERDGNRDIYFGRSTNAGAAWSDPAAIDQAVPSHSDAAEICCAGNAVYAAWLDRQSGDADLYFNASADRGATWGVPRRIDSAPAGVHCRDHRIACEGQKVYAVWQDDRGGARDVFFNRSLDGGANWLAADVRLDTDPLAHDSEEPRIACGGGGVYVVWTDERSGAPPSRRQTDIRFNRSLDSGATWLPADVRIETDAPGAARSRRPIVRRSGTGVYVAWQDDRGMFSIDDIYFNRSMDGGTTWLSSDVRVDTDAPGAFASRNADMACDGDRVCLAWWDDRNSDSILFNRSLDAGATWLAQDIELESMPWPWGLDTGPSLSAGGAAVTVVWPALHTEVSFNTLAYLRRSGDAGTSFPPVMESASSLMQGDQEFPQVLALTPATVFVGWLQHEDMLGKGAVWGRLLSFPSSP